MTVARQAIDDPGPRSAARRLAVQTGLLVVTVLVVAGTVLYVPFVRAAGSAADRALYETVQEVRTTAQAPPGIAVAIQPPAGTLQASRPAPRGFPDRAALAAVGSDGATRERTVDDDATQRDFAVLTARVDGNVVQAWQNRQPGEEAEERLLRALLTAGGVGVVLVALVVAWLARRTVEPLTHTMELQRRFVADASHELRTPLTLLSTRAQLLARRLRNETAGGGLSGAPTGLADDADAVVADSRAMADVLEELLTAADPGSSDDRQLVDLAALVDAVVASCAPQAIDQHLKLALDADRGPVEVIGLAPSLQRAVTSLIDNALDHAQSRVEVALRVVGREAHVVVIDDGPGIPQEVLPRLFERFSSSREPVVTPRRHYGIGLALVADIAAAHGGRISAGSGLHDGGALLELALPRAPSAD